MATEDASRGGSGSGNGLGDDLLALYRRHVGEPTSETDVYRGFALFFGGIALGAIGLGLFLWSAAVTAEAPLFWPLRELAIALACLGLPPFVLSVVVLLPVRRRTVAAATSGAGLCVVAVGAFVAVYPEHWNVQGAADYSAPGIALYAAGLAVLVASTGVALVAHRIQHAHPGATAGGDGDGAPAGGDGSGRRGADATDEQVRRDIEEAMSSADLTWGGVEKTETRRLKIQTDEAEDVDTSGFDRGAAKTARSAGVDDAVDGLKKLQGGERVEAAGEGVEDQTAALQALRAEQRRAADDEPDSVVDRVRDRIGI